MIAYDKYLSRMIIRQTYDFVKRKSMKAIYLRVGNIFLEDLYEKD